MINVQFARSQVQRNALSDIPSMLNNFDLRMNRNAMFARDCILKNVSIAVVDIIYVINV